MISSNRTLPQFIDDPKDKKLTGEAKDEMLESPNENGELATAFVATRGQQIITF